MRRRIGGRPAPIAACGDGVLIHPCTAIDDPHIRPCPQDKAHLRGRDARFLNHLRAPLGRKAAPTAGAPPPADCGCAPGRCSVPAQRHRWLDPVDSDRGWRPGITQPLPARAAVVDPCLILDREGQAGAQRFGFSGVFPLIFGLLIGIMIDGSQRRRGRSITTMDQRASQVEARPHALRSKPEEPTAQLG